MKTIDTTGVHPDAVIVGERYIGQHTLLRARVNGQTLRYITCYRPDGTFKYFRRISSSERKRAGQSCLEINPLETLEWVLTPEGWCSTLNGEALTPVIPFSLIAPTDYTVYWLGDKMASKATIRRLVNENRT